MAVGPGGVPAGIDPSLLTSAAFELVQVDLRIIAVADALCSAQRQKLRQKQTKNETETKTKTETKWKTKTKTRTC